MDELTPAGAGPYQLPSAQKVRIDVAENIVTLVATVLVPGRQAPVSIGIPMTAAVADDLLSLLPKAVALARKDAPKPD